MNNRVVECCNRFEVPVTVTEYEVGVDVVVVDVFEPQFDNPANAQSVQTTNPSCVNNFLLCFAPKAPMQKQKIVATRKMEPGRFPGVDTD